MDDAYQNGVSAPYAGVPQRPSYDHTNDFQSQHYQGQSHESAQALPPIQARPMLHTTSTSYDQQYRPQGIPYTTSGPSYPNYYTQGITQAPFSQSIPQYAPNATYPRQTSQPGGNFDYASASGQNGLPLLRPMPSNNFEEQRPQAGGGQSSSGTSQGNPPRPVVGSQGRRGILPNAEGRPPVASADIDPSLKANFNPAKGADGKYACPHCQKTYLHAKHLKRHHLRHTGDRPYSCFLCGETFSRSDILKRHFQKCSIRRGNPTGATHLSNSQSHLRKQGVKKPDGTSSGSTFSIVTPTDGNPSYGQDSNASRGAPSYQGSDSSKRFSDSSALRDTRPVLNSPPVSNHSTFGVAGQRGPSSLPSSGGSTPVTSKQSAMSSASYTPELTPVQRISSFGGDMASLPSNANNLSNLPRTPHSTEFHNWPPFDQGGRDATADRMPPIQSKDQGRPGNADIKTQYPPSDEQSRDFIPTWFARDGTGNLDSMNGWNPSVSILSQTARLTSFCQLDGSEDPDARLLASFLAPENIEFYYTHYRDFHAHWPFINIASLNVATAYEGLLLAMICVGAIYADRTTVYEVRRCLKYVKRVLKQTEAFRLSCNPLLDASHSQDKKSQIIEQLRALTIVDGVVWHGDDEMRDDVLQCCSGYLRLARSMGLFTHERLNNQVYSPLHQPRARVSTSIEEWDWKVWLHEEQRVRLVMHLFVLEAALAIFFNCPPTVDPAELRLCLPADDVAYDATNAQDCAHALGLCGAKMQQHVNVAGTRTSIQPGLSTFLEHLWQPSASDMLITTNALSKFIIIHALIVQIYTARRSVALGQPSRNLNSVIGALNRWRGIWHRDNAFQYPSHAPPRSGFGRDAEPYYFIAKLKLLGPPTDLIETSPAKRCQRVMTVLSQVKARLAAEEHARKGGRAPDAQSTIISYGTDDLTRDMRLLFAPLLPPPTVGSSPSDSLFALEGL